MNSRNSMLDAVKAGAGDDAVQDMTHKHLLLRGCDPVMAERAKGFIPQLLGNVQMTAVTDDDTFMKLLRSDTVFDVIGFAPGAMRWDARKMPIPGSNIETEGWDIACYKKEIRKLRGSSVPVVGTADEHELVPMLRRALMDKN